MAVSEPLSRQQARELHDRLIAAHDDLIDRIAEELEDDDDREVQEVGGRVRDAGEESVADLLTDMNLTQYRHLAEEVGEIERALADMHAGRYGRCQDCGGFIRYERLQANPTARRCLRCQQKYELEHPPEGAGDSL